MATVRIGSTTKDDRKTVALVQKPHRDESGVYRLCAAFRYSHSDIKESQMKQGSDNFSLDDFARRIADSLPENLRGLGEDLQRNLKATLRSGLERMDLVTREDFDIQQQLLARTRAKLEELEARVAELEDSRAE
jgi:BMFP domain-containing protein YqiC